MYENEIVIDHERLKHFPKTVPMNIREAILVAGQALNRIQAGEARKGAVEGEIPKKVSVPVSTARKRATNTKVPAKRRKKANHSRTRTIFFSESYRENLSEPTSTPETIVPPPRRRGRPRKIKSAES